MAHLRFESEADYIHGASWWMQSFSTLQFGKIELYSVKSNEKW